MATGKTKPALEIVEPIGARVLIRKDEDKKRTKAGLHLPDKIEIPTLTGRIVSISAQVASSLGRRRPEMATAAPARAKASARALPMPEPPPVIQTT